MRPRTGLLCRAVGSWQARATPCGAFCLGGCLTSLAAGLRTWLPFFSFLLVNLIPRAGHTFMRLAPVGHSIGRKYFIAPAPGVRLRAGTERMCALPLVNCWGGCYTLYLSRKESSKCCHVKIQTRFVFVGNRFLLYALTIFFQILWKVLQVPHRKCSQSSHLR